MLIRWLAAPVSYQLWFIRSLFLYNLLYPVFKWAVVKYPAVLFTLLLVGWLTFFHFFLLEAQGMLFYALGIWLCKSNYPIQKKPAWFSPFPAWLLFIGLNIIKTFMAFAFEEHHFTTIVGFSVIHVTTAIAGVLAVWYSADALVARAMQKKWFTRATAFSFIIYAFHVPLLPYFTHLAYRYLHHLTNYRLLTYLIVPLLVLFICIGTGALLRVTMPHAYKVATGGRGFYRS